MDFIQHPTSDLVAANRWTTDRPRAALIGSGKATPTPTTAGSITVCERITPFDHQTGPASVATPSCCCCSCLIALVAAPVVLGATAHYVATKNDRPPWAPAIFAGLAAPIGWATYIATLSQAPFNHYLTTAAAYIVAIWVMLGSAMWLAGSGRSRSIAVRSNVVTVLSAVVALVLALGLILLMFAEFVVFIETEGASFLMEVGATPLIIGFAIYYTRKRERALPPRSSRSASSANYPPG